MRLSLYCRVCLLCSAHVDSQLMLATDISDHHATRISAYLLNKLPLNIERFYESIGFRVTARLSHTLQNIPFSPGERPDGLEDHLKHEKMALASLDELRKLLQDEDLFKRDVYTKTKKRSQQLSKSSEHSAGLEGVMQRFEALGLRVPRTRCSAEEMIQKIIGTERRILKVIFCYPYPFQLQCLCWVVSVFPQGDSGR